MKIATLAHQRCKVVSCVTWVTTWITTRRWEVPHIYAPLSTAYHPKYTKQWTAKGELVAKSKTCCSRLEKWYRPFPGTAMAHFNRLSSERKNHYRRTLKIISWQTEGRNQKSHKHICKRKTLFHKGLYLAHISAIVIAKIYGRAKSRLETPAPSTIWAG